MDKKLNLDWDGDRCSTYEEILAVFERQPSDVAYTLKEGGEFINDEDWVELKDFKYRQYNLMGQRLSWMHEKRNLTKGWSRKKKCKINNRLIRFFRNCAKKCKS